MNSTETLSAETLDEIYCSIKSAFSDFHLFDELVSTRLRTALRESNHIVINPLNTKNVVYKYFDLTTFKTREQKLILDQIKLIFKTTYVLILSKYKNFQTPEYNYTEKEFKLQYFTEDESNVPFLELSDSVEDMKEINYLVRFRNILKIGLTIIPARLNKALLIRIGARLEGSQIVYITGGGQTSAVTRRVIIYETEGRFPAQKREPKTVPATNNGHVNNANGLSNKKRVRGMENRRTIEEISWTKEDIDLMGKPPKIPFPSKASNVSDSSKLKVEVHHLKNSAPISSATDSFVSKTTLITKKLELNRRVSQTSLFELFEQSIIPEKNVLLNEALDESSPLITKPTEIRRFHSTQSETWGNDLIIYQNSMELDLRRFPSQIDSNEAVLDESLPYTSAIQCLTQFATNSTENKKENTGFEIVKSEQIEQYRFEDKLIGIPLKVARMISSEIHDGGNLSEDITNLLGLKWSNY